MTIHNVDKKLRESRFFLDRMHECESAPVKSRRTLAPCRFEYQPRLTAV
jgi:hypothetical protein